MKKIYHQNNYTNQILHTISKQVNTISTQIEAIAKKNDIDSLIEHMEDLNLNKGDDKSKSQFLDDISKPYSKINLSINLKLSDKYRPLVLMINEKLDETQVQIITTKKVVFTNRVHVLV